jgi:penicillin-binding protein 1A
MRVALAKRPPEERPQPDGVVRENDDWVYAEFAENPTLGAIDLDQQPAPDPNAPVDPNAPPPQQPAEKPQQQQLQNSLF